MAVGILVAVVIAATPVGAGRGVLRQVSSPRSMAVRAQAMAVDEERGANDLHCVCARCGAVYVADMEVFQGKGARVRCSVCSNTWFQFTDRLIETPAQFVLAPFPPDRKEDRPAAIDSPRGNGAINMYVGNMPFSLTDVDLARMFGEYGEVTKLLVIRDPMGRSKGFGFVEMAERQAGEAAIQGLHERVVDGRAITVAPRDMPSKKAS